MPHRLDRSAASLHGNLGDRGACHPGRSGPPGSSAAGVRRPGAGDAATGPFAARDSSRSSGCSRTRRASACSRRSPRGSARGLAYPRRARRAAARRRAEHPAAAGRVQVPRGAGGELGAPREPGVAGRATAGCRSSGRSTFKASQADRRARRRLDAGAGRRGRRAARHRARQAFIAAMDDWDEAAADAAIAGLAADGRRATRSSSVLARYGARDFRDIGHKAIYVANSFRTLEVDRLAARRAGAALARLRAARSRRRGESRHERTCRPTARTRNRRRGGRSAPTGSTDARAPTATAELLRRAARRDAATRRATQASTLLNRGVAPQLDLRGLFTASASC